MFGRKKNASPIHELDFEILTKMTAMLIEIRSMLRHSHNIDMTQFMSGAMVAHALELAKKNESLARRVAYLENRLLKHSIPLDDTAKDFLIRSDISR